MKNPGLDPMLVKISLGVAIATIAGGVLGAALADKLYYTHGYVSDPVVQNAVLAINKLTAGRTHTLKPLETSLDGITTTGMAVTRHDAQGRLNCTVFVNVDLNESNAFSHKVKNATGWDDFANSVYILGHELQHCETRADIEDLKASTRGTHVNLIRAVAPSDDMVTKLMGADDAQLEALSGELRRTARAANLEESISDIVGLLLVQKLTPGGLSAEAVEGLIRVRNHNARFDKIHNTTASLHWLATRLHIDPTYGLDLSIREMAGEAYAIVAKANPYTTASVEHTAPAPSI